MFNINSELGQTGTKIENYFSTRIKKNIFHTSLSNSFSKVQSIQYQEIPLCTTAIIETKFESSTQLEKENNYAITAYSGRFRQYTQIYNATSHLET